MSQPSLPTNGAPQVPMQSALALAHAGRLAEAIDTLRRATVQHPAHLQLRCLLGVMLQESGDNDAALAELDHAVALAPRDAALHETRASMLLAMQRFSAAETAARAALQSHPRRPRALQSLAIALAAQGHNAEALSILQTLHTLQPDNQRVRRLLARQLLLAGDAREALAVATYPGGYLDLEVVHGLAADFCALAPHAQTLSLLHALLASHADDYVLRIALARTLHQAGRSSEALLHSERAHTLAPHEFEPLEMRAVSLLDRGEVDAGLAVYRELLTRGDASAESANRHLILLHYDPAQDNAALFDAHMAWTQRYIRAFGAPFRDARPRDPQRRLRIGWLSPRFSDGPVTTFFSGLLGAFDRTGFEHCLVPLRASDAPANARLRELADDWLDARTLDDASLLQRLREAQFDIVIDLAGHSFGHRLNVLAQRVAPIQLCWLDYFNSTAIAAMDGWISDAWLTPADSSQRYTERVLRLEAGRFCYTPPIETPAAQRVGNGAPVFASFNRLAKLNDQVLDAWARILHSVPDAQLELGAHLLADTVARARTLERFAQRGIGSERLRLQATRSYADLLSAYRHVDIALDPFPFSGCTTSCDALWMGVPVIALQGKTFVARQSASLLARLGHAEWIAHDTDAYIELAVRAAGNVEALRAGRDALREQVRARLCDAPAQARDFAALLRALWIEHCAPP